jgi:hypothetical protein
LISHGLCGNFWLAAVKNVHVHGLKSVGGLLAAIQLITVSGVITHDPEEGNGHENTADTRTDFKLFVAVQGIVTVTAAFFFQSNLSGRTYNLGIRIAVRSGSHGAAIYIDLSAAGLLLYWRRM